MGYILINFSAGNQTSTQGIAEKSRMALFGS